MPYQTGGHVLCVPLQLKAAAVASGGTSLAIEVQPPAYSSQAGPQPTGRTPNLDPEAHEALKVSLPSELMLGSQSQSSSLA